MIRMDNGDELIPVTMSDGAENNDFKMGEGEGGKVYVDNYDDLLNKPKVNDIELSGNKTFEDLGITRIENKALMDMVDKLFSDVFGGTI